jgi:hypothetical protein
MPQINRSTHLQAEHVTRPRLIDAGNLDVRAVAEFFKYSFCKITPHQFPWVN